MILTSLLTCNEIHVTSGIYKHAGPRDENWLVIEFYGNNHHHKIILTKSADGADHLTGMIYSYPGVERKVMKSELGNVDEEHWLLDMVLDVGRSVMKEWLEERENMEFLERTVVNNMLDPWGLVSLVLFWQSGYTT